MNTKWNLSHLFKSDTDPKMAPYLKEVELTAQKFIKKWRNRTDYLTKPEVLAQALKEYEQWNRHYGLENKVMYYWWLRTQQDQSDPKIKAEYNKAHEFTMEILNQIQFFELNLAKIDPKLHQKFLKFPGLLPYQHFLDKLFTHAKHLLSEPEEKIMNLKQAQAHDNWTQMVSGLLSKQERKVKNKKANFSEIYGLLDHPDKKTRDSAAEAFNDILAQYVEVAEAEMNNLLMDKKMNDQIRQYDRPEKARHLSDDIDSETVDQLVEAVSSRFDIPQRFYKLKAKLLGLKKLAYHERNLEYGAVKKKYTYERAFSLVHHVFTNLDPQFAAIMSQFDAQGLIDVPPAKGKRSGAFCAYGSISMPIYTLLNFTGKLNDVLTLSHELGHGINDELMRSKQNALNFGTPLSTAEVASTFMEDFVLEEILKTADNKLKLSIMMMKLNDDVSTIFRQIALYKFEQEMHQTFRQKGYLSKEELGQIFTKHMKAYMGPAVEQSPGSQNWWIHISHFRSYFYVYSYASGLLISKSLQGFVKEDPQFISRVKEFLAAGLSDSPKNIFLNLGIDISDPKFWEKGLTQIDHHLKETEKLCDTIN